MQQLVADGVLVAYVNLMTTPTKEKLAEKLAAAIYEHVASPLERAREAALAPFRGLRMTPRITIDPEDGSLHASRSASTTFRPTSTRRSSGCSSCRPSSAAGGTRRVALVFDEFQEIETIDPGAPEADADDLRAAARGRPRLPGQPPAHDGADLQRRERAVLAQRQEGRSSDVIEPRALPPVHRQALQGETRKDVAPEIVDELLERTAGHPYATQELCYFLWEQTPFDGVAGERRAGGGALAGVLRSEHAHFQLRWDQASAAQKLLLQALAAEPGRPLTDELPRPLRAALGRHAPVGARGRSTERELVAQQRRRLLPDRRAVPRRMDPGAERCSRAWRLDPRRRIESAGYAVAGGDSRGKSGHRRARTVGNADPGKPAGKWNRDRPPMARPHVWRVQARVKRCGKSAPASR